MSKPVRTETMIREIDADGRVIKETTTVVTVEQPPPEQAASTGMYL